MSTFQLLVFISTLSLFGFWPVSSQDNDSNCAFEIGPMDRTVSVNDTNVMLHCQSPQISDAIFDAITWEIFLLNGTFWTVSGADEGEQLARGLVYIRETTSLKIVRVQAFHAGMYRCMATRILGGTCRYVSDNATVVVEGPAMIDISEGPNFPVNTTKMLQICGTVDGHPEPNVTLYKVVDDQESMIHMDHPRITVTLMDTKLTITVLNAQVSDSGMYRIRATNERGGSYEDFYVTTMGPDPPVVSVPRVVVTGVNQRVQVSCSVQATANVDENSHLNLEWRYPNNTTIPTLPSSSPIYVMPESDLSVALVFANFTFPKYDAKCVATNIKSNSSGHTVIYVPPVPPKPSIKQDDRGSYTVSWRHVETEAPVVMYVINVNEANTDELVRTRNVTIPSGGRDLTSVVGTFPAGDYDVRVLSVAVADNTTAMSSPSPPATFSVEGAVGSESSSVIVIGAVSGGVGVVVLIVVGILVGAFFLCFYSHRRQMNSQQQRWNSEEDKIDSAVPNTYTTTLSLHPATSELPPSPSTPLISAFFSTEVDPKWEFPRENIQLKDVLHEGQFTILYKGAVKGIKERTVEVAVKSVRDDANEDDVKALISEMETLAGLGPHPNIVSLLRVCTVGSPMYVVTEYMCHGDLLGFLRASRGHHGMYHVSPGTRYQPPTLNLCSRDLLNVATKIANGMRYLADRKLVHRALCAKNVLVGPGMDIKIYNVGSFDISFESRDYYMKWMAPETLFDHTTTTYSDVWSFGVTLWEIVTVGGAPYAEVLPEDLYSQLHNGMRMPKPHHCAQEVYNIMWQCWLRNPTDRPYFAVIHENLEELVESKISYIDLRQYNQCDYSQFDDAHQQLSTAL